MRGDYRLQVDRRHEKANAIKPAIPTRYASEPTLSDIRAMSEPNPTGPTIQLIPLAGRGAFGGLLMGIANLVPGISGGTMLLAAGVYPRFIEAVAEITTLRFRAHSLLLLGAVVFAALLTILLFAGPIKDLVVHHRWIMYSLFIGLTLGGLPVIWTMTGERSPAFWVAALVGFGLMALLAYAQMNSDASGAVKEGFGIMLLAGVAGASAMILPGVSGGYLWLVLGVYIPILAGIDAGNQSLATSELALLPGPMIDIVIPVGIGVLLGVGVVSNLLRWVLAHRRNATLGILMGLLAGAVVGLWPFQGGVAPNIGQQLKGQTVAIDASGTLIYSESGRPIKPEHYPTRTFTPDAVQIGSVIGLILGGFVLTLGIARLSKEDD